MGVRELVLIYRGDPDNLGTQPEGLRRGELFLDLKNDSIIVGTGSGAYYDLFPPGIMRPTGSSTSSPKWLLCDGSAVSRTLYPRLFSVIGVTFGAGDGSTTFNLPDMTAEVIDPVNWEIKT